MNKNSLFDSTFDILNLFGLPTNSLQTLWNTHCNNKLNKVRDILLDELSVGNINLIEEDDKLSLL